MNEKARRVAKYWGHPPAEFSYNEGDPHELARFTGTHPAIIQPWLASDAAEHHYELDLNHVPNKRQKRHRLRMKIEKFFGADFSKKHFKLVA
jgi:hypothetical protein